MSNVVEMQSFQAANPMPPHRSLRLLSRSLSVLFAFFAAIQLAWVLAAWIATLFFSDHLMATATGFDVFTKNPPVIPGGVLFATQPVLTRVVAMIGIAIAAAPFLMVFWELRGLFRLYARGIVFARENAISLKHIGLYLVAYPFVEVGVNLVFRLAGGLDKAWFHMEIVYALVAGLTVLAIAQVMEFGHDIEQEKDSFV